MASEENVNPEVARQVGRQTQHLHEEITSLRDTLSRAKNDLVRQHKIIQQLSGDPVYFGTLVKSNNYPDPRLFKNKDEVLVTDHNSPHYNKGGIIISGGPEAPVLDENGCVRVKLFDDVELTLSVGLEGKAPAQVRLSSKNDGTSAIVSIEGTPWEVNGVPDQGLAPGDCVKLRGDNKQIVGRGDPDMMVGPIARVTASTPNGVEVDVKGELRLVRNPKQFVLEESDRVVLDKGVFHILSKLPADNHARYKLSQESKVTWDDIGGLLDAKRQLQDAIELPYKHPDLFAHYGVLPCRGILLYGPPGCGKSLLLRVCAWSIAQTHGKEAVDSGYIYVKAPEILDKWVGNTEAEIRYMFDRGRRHYRKHGYKAILVIEEAEAILPQRGTRISSGIADTMVPMFLGEMDGVDDLQTQENPIVVLLTNRPDILDPAVTRSGRVDKHIKIDRPDQMTSIDILNIHTKKLPFADEKNRMSILAVAVTDLFSKNRLIYRINNEHDFTLGDAISGAMLAGVAEKAKMNALHRDLQGNTRSGLTIEDFRQGVTQLAQEQRGLNHAYDLQDFAEKLGIQAKDMHVDRCFSAA